MIPETYGVTAKLCVPVPPVYTNAVEVSPRPNVVVIFVPAVRVSAPLTVIVMGAEPVAPTESVAIIVS